MLFKVGSDCETCGLRNSFKLGMIQGVTRRLPVCTEYEVQIKKSRINEFRMCVYVVYKNVERGII